MMMENLSSSSNRICTIKLGYKMMMILFYSFVLSSIEIKSAFAQSVTNPEPSFLTRSEIYKFVAGDTITLPCEVDHSDKYIVAWKRGIAILSAGNIKVSPDPRVKLIVNKNSYSLQISDVTTNDAGDYVCQIATLKPAEIQHTVEILVPPRIHHISSGNHLQVKKGSAVRIECSASGNPTPNVTWTRKNNVLPNGDSILHSSVITIDSMDRHKGGIYVCTADNNVGQAASSQVIIHVLYPPDIVVETPMVHAGEQVEATLVCIVHGEPQPHVIWFKETMQIDVTERHSMQQRGSRYSLLLRKVHQQDFGNYTCLAENSLGRARKTLELTGLPNKVIFLSPPVSHYKDRYNITWSVDSHTPVEEFKLFYRMFPHGQHDENSLDESQQNIQLHLNHRGGNNGVYNVYQRNDWRDVVLPSIPLSHEFTQVMSYIIRGLEPDQQYEVRVQAKNRYGWNQVSDKFSFSTTSNDVEMRDMSVTYIGKTLASLSSASSTNHNSIINSMCYAIVKVISSFLF